MDRRHFLYSSAATAAGLGLPLLGALAQRQASAQVAADYKALVCVYLFGGNDGHNTLVPYESRAHADYLAMRPVYSGLTKTGLGIPRDELLPLASSGEASGTALHPKLTNTLARWSKGNVAFLQNIGNLVQPLSRATFSKRQRPVGLGAHDEQQNISMLALQDPAGEGSEFGWGSRMWQRWALTQGISANAWAKVSFAGQNRWQSAVSQPLLALEPNASLALDFRQQIAPLIADGQKSARPFARAYADTMSSAYSMGEMINSVFGSTNTTGYQAFTTASRGVTSGFYGQLLSVARFIEARTQLSVPGRQIFFVSLGGFDTHDTQYVGHANLLQAVDGALHSFMSAMESLDLYKQVTAFTLSDFGRTLWMNASNGTDHAWASHSLVMGGAVNGGLYGRSANLTPGSDDIAPYSNNVVIPSLSVDQCAATLGGWMGLNVTDLDAVFPNLRNFDVRNLGFMNA